MKYNYSMVWVYRVVIIFLMVFVLLGSGTAQEVKKNTNKKYFEVYRVIGKGKDLQEAREDAYQNAIIDFLKKKLTPKTLKENSEKILKEIFPSKKIKEFIESYKIVSSEDSSDSIKIVVDVVLRSGKLIETLNKINVPIKTEKLEEEESE